jgi:hypothetical protein
MGKINQIQNALKELSEGKFQKLADAYLIAKKIGNVSSVGSVIGADKTRKGRPDTLIALPNGSYALAEHTTQQAGLLEKLEKDFLDCFDEEETGIPVGKIDQVILCFSSKLKPAEVIELQKLAEEQGVLLTLYGIDDLSHDIIQSYPGLARQYLDLELDTGQIVSMEEFVTLHSREKMAAGIDQSFFFRGKELSHLLSTIEQEDLVILTGGAGVGKTRLALELCKKFEEKYSEYQVKCVFGRNRDFWEDLQVYFKRPGDFLLLVDDANMLSNFEYVVDLLLDRRDDRNVKVVVTVREYALQKIREVASRVGEETILSVNPFTDEQIREFLEEEYGIKNYRYIKRIIDIVMGNPRLAVMAAKATLAGGLDSIHNVTDLYEEYFSTIKDGLLKEKEELDVDTLIKAIAIISLFEAVDHSNSDMVECIEETFFISSRDFWLAACQLHDFELVDMHENEVVRVQDQVLGTYCFHRAFFKDKLLNFGLLLRTLFPRFRERIIYSINAVTKAFEGQKIIDVIKPHVSEAWTDLENEENNRALLELIDAFWITDTTRTLLWVERQMESMEYQPAEEGDIQLEGNDSVPRPSVLSILSGFANAGENDARVAIDLLLQYLQIKPIELPLVLSVLTGEYGYDENSYLRKYEIQHSVVDIIWTRAQGGEPPLSQLFLETARNYLETHVQTFRDTGKHRIEILEYDIPITPELTSLREKIWKKLFLLYENERSKEGVLEAVLKYTKIPKRDIKSVVVKEDMDQALPFLEKTLDVESYQHSIIGNAYLDYLEDHGIEAPDGARDQFGHATYELARVLLMDYGEIRELDLSHGEYEKAKLDRLGKYTEDYVFDDYVHFFERCNEIRSSMEERQEYQLRWGMSNALLLLSNRNPDLCERVLEHYFNLDDPIRLNGYPIINSLIEHRGPEQTFVLFLKRKYRRNSQWLFYLHELMPVENISKRKLKHLYKLYRRTKAENLPRDMDFLLKYCDLDRRVIAKVVSIVLKRAKRKPAFTYALFNLFNPHMEAAKILPEVFSEDVDLLKRAYLCAEQYADLSDHKGKFFAIIMNLDRDFIIDYIDWKYETSEKGWLSSHDVGRDYSFLWELDNYQEILSKVVDHVYSFERGGYSSLDPILGAFFGGEEKEETLKGERLGKQDNFLLSLIEERGEDAEFIRYLFRLIACFSPGRRIQYVEQFVSKNDDINVFRRLNLEPSSWSWSGSQVFLLQERADFWDSLLSVMSTKNLLEHKKLVEDQIRLLENQIDREKKSDFIEDR